MSKELKSCPFCGEKVEQALTDSSPRVTALQELVYAAIKYQEHIDFGDGRSNSPMMICKAARKYKRIMK